MFHRKVCHSRYIHRKVYECETAFMFISSEAVTHPPIPSIWYSDMKPNTWSDPTQLCFNPSMRCVNVLMLYVNTTWQSVVKVAGQRRNCEVHIFCVLSVGDVRCSTRNDPESIFPMASPRRPLKNIKEGPFRLQLFAFALSVGGLSLFGFSVSLKCKLQY